MQHLDHDMDDLFRKAAESYPLKTELDDWDKLAGKILSNEPAVVATKGKRIKSYGFLLVTLVLLLVLSGVFYYGSINKRKMSAISDSSAISIKKVIAGKPGGTDKTPRGIGEDSIVTVTAIPPGTRGVTTQALVTQKTFSSQFSHRRFKKSSLIINKSIDHFNARSPFEASFTKKQLVSEDDKVADLPGDIFEALLKAARISAISNYDSANVTALSQLPPIITVKKQKPSGRKGFYVGLNIGPELSKVGSQAHTKAGYQGGVLVGYKLNGAWSLESGLLIGRNNYYSRGDYFNMSKIAPSMPTGMSILAVDGQTERIQVPVMLRYNFIQRRQFDLFFSGGLLSDLYLREKNHYKTLLNGVTDRQMGLYDGNTLMVASQLRIGVGYEHPISKSGSIRIEPYKNIPLQKSGMGSMSIYSSGLNLTLNHFIR